MGYMGDRQYSYPAALAQEVLQLVKICLLLILSLPLKIIKSKKTISHSIFFFFMYYDLNGKNYLFIYFKNNLE